MSVNYPLLPPKATAPAISAVSPLRLVQAQVAQGLSVICTASATSAAAADSVLPDSDTSQSVQPRDPGFSPGNGVLIDPVLISFLPRVMRSERSFSSADFTRLMRDIALCGGNLEPVLLRLLTPGSDGQARYELVSGHRRLEACRRLGIKVFAFVIGASDAAAAQITARSNMMHAKPAPYELGCIYQVLLADAVYSSQKELAKHLGANQSEVSNALILSHLDADLLSAFATPLDLRYGDARVLGDAWRDTQFDVQQRIAQVLAYPPLTFTHDHTVDILRGLCAAMPEDQAKAIKIEVHVVQTLVATIRMSRAGRVVIDLTEKNWPLQRLNALVPGLKGLLGGATLDLDLSD